MGTTKHDPYPLDPDLLEAGHLVTEMMMKPNVTRFLHAANEKGCDAQVDYGALKGQAKANI
ncbi:MAG: hypothetical protein KJN87_00335 [Desulfofustis sp.]|nr:hypothetical protein [Desulfofustis sp.]MBT8346638.1 hypothetical protein [Desulfofustis sp.]NNF48060.1 hypothetical protein [Desulfofustis sp.]NNK56435.1 hypothetical protein [Desulfofustis sp.]